MALIGNDPGFEPHKQFLIARTEGNPFFLDESVRALVETGVLVGDPGAHRLVKPLDSLQVPPTVESVLAARIDRLQSGEAQIRAGSMEEAHTLAEHTLTLAREHQERGNEAYALNLLGNITARREPQHIETTETYYRQALVLAEERGMRPLVAQLPS